MGSAILAAMIVWQVKTVPPELGAVLKYNLYILIPMFIANVALGLGFIKAHETFKNMPMILVMQTAIYYCIVISLSYFILGEKMELGRLLTGFALILAGIYVLK
jgi:hypothetical protein